MRTFIFIHGPNGVGKSTVCKVVHQQLAHSAWLESEWRRMTRDGREPSRIRRVLEARSLYNALPYPRIDTTRLSVQETADRIIEIARRAGR